MAGHNNNNNNNNYNNDHPGSSSKNIKKKVPETKLSQKSTKTPIQINPELLSELRLEYNSSWRCSDCGKGRTSTIHIRV